MFYCQVCGCENTNEISCSSCGTNPFSERNFCSNCGVRLKEHIDICPNCDYDFTQVKLSNHALNGNKYINTKPRASNSKRLSTNQLIQELSREKDVEIEKILITTTNNLEGYVVDNYFGLISNKVVIGTSIFSDFFAGITDFVGGRSNTFESELNGLEMKAIHELKRKAYELDCNAILGFTSDLDEISGKGTQMFMISVYGTAVKISMKNNLESNL